MSRAPVRIGVVGVGRMGRLHAATLAGLAEADLVALVEPSELGDFLPGVLRFATLDSALETVSADAWVVATRTPLHIETTARLLDAGAFVLVEKPLAQSVDAARSLAPRVAAAPNRLMLGHLLLFCPEFRRLQALVAQRGAPRYFHAVRHRPLATLDQFPEETPLSLLMVHDLYLAFALRNGAAPTRLSARLRRRPDGRCDLAEARLEWPDGGWGTFTASFLTPPGMGDDGFDRLEVFGDGWAATLHPNPQNLRLYTDRLSWPIGLAIEADPAAPSGWLAEELRRFCRVVRGTATIPLGARYDDALVLQEWMAALAQSALEADQNAR